MQNIDPKLIELALAFLYAIIPTIITLFITERIKGKINSRFDKKIESIRKDHAIEISKFETELTALKTQENFKFTKLHEKRMEVLEKTYKYLNDALFNLNSYVVPFKHTSPETTFEENEIVLHDKFRQAQNIFASYISDNRIYFDDEIEQLIDNYMTEVISIFNDYYENHFMKQLGDSFNKESHLKAATAYKRIPEKIVPLKKEIEKKFKTMLDK